MTDIPQTTCWKCNGRGEPAGSDEGAGESCDACQGHGSVSVLDGALWPWMPEGNDSLPWVERGDDSDRFDTDDEAAHYVAELIGGRVMWAYVDQASDYTEQGDDLLPYAERDDPRDRLRPFVLPQTASLIYEHRGFGESDFDFWTRERDSALNNLNKKEA